MNFFPGSAGEKYFSAHKCEHPVAYGDRVFARRGLHPPNLGAQRSGSQISVYMSFEVK